MKIQQRYSAISDCKTLYIGDEVIEATAEHPFWLDGKGWTEVKDLKVGDFLVTSGGLH